MSGGASCVEEVQESRRTCGGLCQPGERRVRTHHAYHVAWQAFARWFEGLGREAPAVWRRLASDLDLRKLDGLTKDVALTDVIQVPMGCRMAVPVNLGVN